MLRKISYLVLLLGFGLLVAAVIAASGRWAFDGLLLMIGGYALNTIDRARRSEKMAEKLAELAEE
ncbi:hypothetical protein GTO10_01635 [Candidatus Saccharibacteria bacterium]|nr:hypothetical protein [Candidatus Saccharibacteria bacterium]